MKRWRGVVVLATACAVAIASSFLLRSEEHAPLASAPLPLLASASDTEATTLTAPDADREEARGDTQLTTPRVTGPPRELRGAAATVQQGRQPSPGSPLALLALEEAAKYRPTLENLQDWVQSVPDLEDLDPQAIEWSSNLEEAWGICREQQALRAFVLGHQGRERQRWRDREQSVSLEAELHPVRDFMNRQLGHDEDLWRLINQYSNDVQAQIRSEGESADLCDDEESRWKLLQALSSAGSPAFEAVVDVLEGRN